MKKKYDFSKAVKNPYRDASLATVYFDRNVFSDIGELRRGLTREDVAVIEQAVQSKSVIIPASITLFEETIRVLRESDEKYDQHIRTVFGLIHKEEMVKPPNQLLRDDCYSYAEGSRYERLTPTPSRMSDILDLSRNREDLLTLAEEITQRFQDSAANITEGLLAARVAGEERNVGTPDDFSEVWSGLSTTMVDGVLSQVPRPIRRLCKKRGLDKILRIKSIRLYTIYYAWLIHSGWFGVQGDPRKMKEGDVGDFFHAVQASSATVFVTQESKDKRDRLPFILNQIPTAEFTIMGLSEFVEYLRHAPNVAAPQTTLSPAAANKSQPSNPYHAPEPSQP
jgi:hypothetical protein